MKEVTEKELREEINSGETLIVKFHAKWCGPCKAYTPVFESVTKEVKAFSIDIDEANNLVKELEIRSIPHTVVFKNKKALKKEQGMLTKDQINDLIKANF